MLILFFFAAAALAIWSKLSLNSGGLTEARGKPIFITATITSAVLLLVMGYNEIQAAKEREQFFQLFNARRTDFDKQRADFAKRRDEFDQNFEERQREFETKRNELKENFETSKKKFDDEWNNRSLNESAK